MCECFLQLRPVMDLSYSINSLIFIYVGVSKMPKLEMSTYWEGEAPPSSVLGVGASIPSVVFGPLSVIAFVVGTYSIHESNILNQITVNTINPIYLAGSVGVPLSWGLHVAAWIQQKNGK